LRAWARSLRYEEGVEPELVRSGGSAGWPGKQVRAVKFRIAQLSAGNRGKRFIIADNTRLPDDFPQNLSGLAVRAVPAG